MATTPAPLSPELSFTAGGGPGTWALVPSASRAEFHVRHFWGAITVHGHFERVAGTGTVASDGSISGRLVIEAASLDTHNPQRDRHLRSADFFDVERHPEVTVTVHEARWLSAAELRCTATLEAGGHSEPLEFTAAVQNPSVTEVTLEAEVVIDRTRLGMTWSPLGMAARTARLRVAAHFVRQ